MARGDIGNHVNLKLETVSRMLSHFQKAGLIAVRQRCVRLLDPQGLRQLSRPAAFDPG